MYSLRLYILVAEYSFSSATTRTQTIACWTVVVVPNKRAMNGIFEGEEEKEEKKKKKWAKNPDFHHRHHSCHSSSWSSFFNRTTTTATATPIPNVCDGREKRKKKTSSRGDNEKDETDDNRHTYGTTLLNVLPSQLLGLMNWLEFGQQQQKRKVV